MVNNSMVIDKRSFSQDWVDPNCQSENSDTTKGLWRKGVLVQIQGGIWSMEARLNPSDIDVEPSQIPQFAKLGKKRLLDQKNKNAFLNIIGKARSAAERFGFPFVLTGSYFIPFGNIDRLKDIIAKQQEQFNSEADRFVASYADKIGDYLDSFSPEHRERLEPHYPSPEKLRRTFKFNAVYYVVSMSQMISESVDADDMYLNWAVDSMNTLRSEARDVANAVQKANAEGSLDGRTMRRVQTLIDRLQNMDILEDSSLRGAALALATDVSSETAEALKEAAANVSTGRVRAVFLD